MKVDITEQDRVFRPIKITMLIDNQIELRDLELLLKEARHRFNTASGPDHIASTIQTAIGVAKKNWS